MQSTRDLILQYGSTYLGDPDARRLRKRLRTRATKGDQLARAFLGTTFKRGTVPQIQWQLRAWLDNKGEVNGKGTD